MQILVINSVPLNGGDEALLSALVFGLREVINNPKVTVTTSHPQLASRYIPGLDFDYDLEYVKTDLPGPVWNSDNIKLRVKNLMGLEKQRTKDNENRILSLIEKADIIISSPGGYLHDYYENSGRFDTFEYILAREKPLYFIGHSIGPFWKPDSISRMREILHNASGIYLREKKSLENIRELGVDIERVVVGTDLAFLLHRPYQGCFRSRRTIHRPVRIAMNFREWEDTATSNAIIRKAVVLVNWILNHFESEITFVSTCQGIEEYVDDSKVAEIIVRQLKPGLKNKCLIDRIHRNPKELIKEYSSYDAYIGMRLHGAILAMLGGTPAFIIGYEAKSEGVFEAFGLYAYHISHTCNISMWQKYVDEFLLKLIPLHEIIEKILPNTKEKALTTFSHLYNNFLKT